MLLPRLPFLDPRADDNAAARPIESAVNIPIEELADRMHELPSRHCEVLVAGEGGVVTDTIAYLAATERKAVAAEGWSYGRPSAGRLWEPNPFLLDHLPVVMPGAALDLACGSGREAVAMAAYGWSVVAVDNLEDALAKGRDLAERYLAEDEAAKIEWRAMDLKKDVPSGAFDLITMFYYLDRDLLRRMSEQLNPGGLLMVETFTAHHRHEHGKPRREHLVLQTNELPNLLPDLRVVHYDEGWRDGRHTARGVFRR